MPSLLTRLAALLVACGLARITRFNSDKGWKKLQ